MQMSTSKTNMASALYVGLVLICFPHRLSGSLWKLLRLHPVRPTAEHDIDSEKSRLPLPDISNITRSFDLVEFVYAKVAQATYTSLSTLNHVLGCRSGSYQTHIDGPDDSRLDPSTTPFFCPFSRDLITLTAPLHLDHNPYQSSQDIALVRTTPLMSVTVIT